MRLAKKRARHKYDITEKDAKATEEDLLEKGWKKDNNLKAGERWTAPPKREPSIKEGYIKTEHVEGLGPKNVFVLHPEPQKAGDDEPIPPRFPRVPGATKPKDVYSIYKPEHRGKQEVFGEWHQPDPDNQPDHWERNREKKGGWGRTIAFEREQSRRAKEARKQGLNYKGYKLFGPQGINPKQVPQQKSDIGIGPNAEHRLESFKWELMDPEGDKYKPSSLTFSLEHEPPRGDSDVQGEKLHPNLESHEPTLPSILNDVGLRGAMIEQLPEENNQWKYRVTLPQDGAQINPDHAALIKERLDEGRFTLRRKVNEENIPVPDFDYEHPPMRPKVYRVPLASSRSPIRAEDVYQSSVEKLYDKPLNAKIAIRDEQGNLKPGDADVLAVKVGAKKINVAGHDIGFGDRVGYLNLQERSDAVGWGTSWRPGEQEINRTLTAIPRQRDYERLGEALADHDGGNNQKLDSYIKDKYPDADDQQMDRLREEMKTVGAAVGAAGYYTAKKHGKKSIVTRGVNKTWHGARHIPPIRKLDDYVGISNAKNHDLLNFTGETDPFTMKYFRMKSRIRHPIRDIDNPHVAGVHWNIAPDMPAIKFRERLILNRDVEVPARKIEKEAEKIQKVANTQYKIKEAIKNEPTTRRGKFDKRVTLKSASKVEYDPNYEKYLAGNTHAEKEAEWRGIVDAKEPVPQSKEEAKYGWQDEEGAWHKEQRFKPKHPLRVRQAAQNALDTLSDIDSDDIRFTDAEHDVLRAHQTKGWVPIEDTKLMSPKVLKAGKVGLVGAAATGAGIYLYDRHRSHDLQINPNKQSRVRTVVPETIKTPSLKVKRTKSTTIPLNDVTEGLELAGTKIPTGWKASVSMKEHRIKNKRDVSGEPYSPGPLVGGVKLRAPVPVEGSRSAAIVGAPKGTQIKVGGKSTGLYYEQGEKQRWNDGTKRNKLKSANPARVSQKERQQIALLIKNGTPEERERLQQFYSGDEDLHDMLNDPDEMEEIAKDNKNFYSSKGEVTARDRLKKHKKREEQNLKRAFAGGSTTLREERDQKERDRRARTDRADRERAGYSPGYY